MKWPDSMFSLKYNFNQKAKETLKKFTVSQKITFIGVILAIPMIIQMFFLVINSGKDIDVAEKEIAGLEIIRPLSSVIEFVSLHKLHSVNAASGSEASAAKLTGLVKSASTAFAALDSVFKEHSSYLSLEEEDLKAVFKQDLLPENLRKEFDKIVEKTSIANAGELESEHDKLLAGLFSLLKLTGDNSNLILDPELDTYYMMDIVVITMPEIIKLLSATGVEISKTIHSEDGAGEATFEFLTHFNQFKKLAAVTLRENAQLVIRSDEDNHGVNEAVQKEFPALTDTLVTELNSLLDQMGNIASGMHSKENGSLIMKVGDVSGKAFTYWQKSGYYLEDMLGERIGYYSRIRFAAIFISLFAIVFGGWLTITISRQLIKPITEVSKISTVIAEGKIDRAKELLEEFDRENNNEGTTSDQDIRDEIWLVYISMNKMVEDLRELLSEVRKSGVHVTSGVTGITSSIRNLEASVAEQAASSNEVNATSKEITAATKDLANMMNDIMGLADETLSLANTGQTGFDEISETMATLTNATKDISEKLKILYQKTGNINNILTTITKVATQTNLLSLNASIEAEKAGEYGAGFSVVAKEIRRLADQTAVAALEIEEMITDMQKAVKEGVIGIEVYSSQTKNYSEKITDISRDFVRIIENTNTIIPRFEMINDGMQMNTKAADQIREAMDQLNDVTNHTKDSISEFREISENLNLAVRSLHTVVSKFSADS